MDACRGRELAEELLKILSSEDSESSKLVRERQLLEQIYKELLADVSQSFNGLFARTQYYHDAHQTPEDIVCQVNALRVMANKAAHGELAQVSPASVASGALCIYQLLGHLTPDFEHTELHELLSDAKAFPRRADARKQSFPCLLKSWNYYKSGGRIAGLELSAITEDGAGISILLRDDQRHPQKAKYSSLAPSLWQYANLYCHELSEVAGKADFYIDNPRTVVVLEPDFLMDASAIAECLTHDGSYPELYLLSRMFAEGSNERMLLGKMINSMFDTLIHEPELDYLELFKRGLHSMSIPMVGIGVQSANKIFKEIQDSHLEVISQYCSEIRKHDLLLEPSFLCPAFGLQGRLDLLYHHKSKFSIVELKGGKAHPHDVWPAQMYQVVAYNMIIRNAYGSPNLGSSSILYSGSKDKPLRNVANMPLLEQNLMICRNRIVGIMHLLSLNPDAFFSWLNRTSGDGYSTFSKEHLQRFKRVMQGIRSYEYDWFCAQVRRIVREIWQVKTGSDSSESSYGHNALWRKSPEEKEGKIIQDLQILSYDQQEIRLGFAHDPRATDFRIGDIILLYQQKRRVDQQEIIRGVIREWDAEGITLNIRGGIRRKLLSSALWALEHDVIESFLYNPLSALSAFLEAGESTRDLYLGLREPVTVEPKPTAGEQAQVLARMQAAKELFVVQGPPGTGKTSGLIGNYISDFYRDTDQKMLVLSFTNRAVDEICLCLRKRKVPFIRTGNSRVIDNELLNNLVHGKCYKEMDAILRTNRIFIATVQSASSWHRDLARLTQLDELIVDEASQIMESSILGLVNLAPKCIFIGDQNQLPAISVQSSLDYSFLYSPLSELQYDAINQSLMERLFRVYANKGWQRHTEMLTGHYRMHQDIARLISHHYDDRLQAMRSEQKAVLEDSALPEYLKTRLLWIECPPATQDYFDPVQVQVVIHLVTELIKAKVIRDAATDIGVVAPYRVMINALREELADISIDTVERFQGSERDRMILCFPLKSAAALGTLQSLSSDGKVDRKLNVALSRAKNQVIILANSEICRQSLHYHRLYENIHHNGNVITAQEILSKGVQNG